MSTNIDLRNTLQALLGKQFICDVSTPELFRLMRDPAFAKEVSDALEPFGRTLSIVGDEASPEAYFCGFIDLQNQQDREQVSKELMVMRDQIGDCIEFFRMIDQAGGNYLSLISGGELPYAKLLDSIENHEPYQIQLRDLGGLKLFDNSRNAKDTGDRLMKVIKSMVDEGYLVKRQNESTVFVFTGKLSYLQQILAWLADYHGCAVDTPAGDEQTASQGGLGI